MQVLCIICISISVHRAVSPLTEDAERLVQAAGGYLGVCTGWETDGGSTPARQANRTQASPGKKRVERVRDEAQQQPSGSERGRETRSCRRRAGGGREGGRRWAARRLLDRGGRGR